jgi:hypothetical protein
MEQYNYCDAAAMLDNFVVPTLLDLVDIVPKLHDLDLLKEVEVVDGNYERVVAARMPMKQWRKTLNMKWLLFPQPPQKPQERVVAARMPINQRKKMLNIVDMDFRQKYPLKMNAVIHLDVVLWLSPMLNSPTLPIC